MFLRREKHPQQEFLQVDTTNILFVVEELAGLDKIIDSRGKGTSIGFGADVKNYTEQPISEILKALEPKFNKIWINSRVYWKNAYYSYVR